MIIDLWTSGEKRDAQVCWLLHWAVEWVTSRSSCRWQKMMPHKLFTRFTMESISSRSLVATDNPTNALCSLSPRIFCHYSNQTSSNGSKSLLTLVFVSTLNIHFRDLKSRRNRLVFISVLWEAKGSGQLCLSFSMLRDQQEPTRPGIGALPYSSEYICEGRRSALASHVPLRVKSPSGGQAQDVGPTFCPASHILLMER